jgi:hypothetical protein
MIGNWRGGGGSIVDLRVMTKASPYIFIYTP